MEEIVGLAPILGKALGITNEFLSDCTCPYTVKFKHSKRIFLVDTNITIYTNRYLTGMVKLIILKKQPREWGASYERNFS